MLGTVAYIASVILSAILSTCAPLWMAAAVFLIPLAIFSYRTGKDAGKRHPTLT